MVSSDGATGRGSPRVMSPQQHSPIGSVMYQGLGTPPPLPPPPPPLQPPPPHHHLHHYVIHPHDMVRWEENAVLKWQFSVKYYLK